MKKHFSFRQMPNVFTTVSRDCNGGRTGVGIDVNSPSSHSSKRGLGKVSTLILLFALSFGFSQTAKAWWTIGYKSASTNWTSVNMGNTGDDKINIYISKNEYFKFHLDDKSCCPGDDGHEMGINSGNNHFYRWDNGECTNAAKYTGNSGIIEVHAKQDGNTDHQPWCWLASRVQVKFKYSWGDTWTAKDATDNNDGTYTLDENYSGTNGFNAGPENQYKYNESKTTIVGNPKSGELCQFKWNAEGYNPTTSEGNDCGTFTITKYCHIEYDANGATSGTIPSASTNKLYGGTETVASNSGSLGKTHYTFTGWNTKADGTGTHYNTGSTFTYNNDVAATTILYAEWTEITHTVNVSAGTGGTVIPSGDQTIGEETQTTITATPATGYLLDNWTSNNVTITNTDDAKVIKITASADGYVTANFKKVQFVVNFGKYSVNADKGALTAKAGSSDINSGDKVDASSEIVFTAEPISGYTVGGWYDNANCEGQKIKDGVADGSVQNYTITSLDEEKTVYVKFIPKTYTNTLDYTNGGSGCTSVTTTFDSNTLTYNTTWNTPTKTGYDFTGYWASATKSTEQSPVALVINTNGELEANVSGYTGENGIWKKDATTTLYAQWDEKMTTVTINVNDDVMGSVTPEEVNVGIDTKVQVVATPNTGYHWTNWTFDPTAISCTTNAATTNLKTNGSLTDGSTGTATAIFAPNEYSITYKDQGGGDFTGTHETDNPTTHTYATATTLKTATKTGHTFQGWFKEQDCSGTRIMELGATDYTANITLYAKWNINTYSISYPQTTEHYTISDSKTIRDQFGSTASFSITPEDGYRVYVTITYGSSQSVTYSHARDAKDYSFNIPAGDVTVNVEVQPYQIGGSFNEWGDKYNFGSNHSLVLNLNAETTYEFKLYNDLYKPAKENISTDGYVGFSGDWNIYESMQNGAMTYAQDSRCFKLHTGAAGNYTITIGNVNNVPAISVTYPNVKEVVILHSSPAENEHLTFTNVSGDIWETSASSALNKDAEYQFRVYWNGTWYSQDASQHTSPGHNMTPSDHTDWTIYKDKREVNLLLTPFRGTNSPNSQYRFRFNASTKQLTVIYPSFITGTMNSWGFTPLTFVNNVATYDYESDGNQFQYKIIDDGVYYGKKDDTTIDCSASFTLEPTQSESRNVVVNPTGSGTYTITYNNSTKDNTVQFPDNTRYNVTVYYDGVTETKEQAGATGGLALRAVTKPGYRFAGWVVEGVTDAVHIAVPQNEATILYCDKDGGKVRATYSNDKFIYFKNTTNWGNVYVQFYVSGKTYMDDSKGTGTCYNDDNSNEALVHATIYTMTHIDKTDIWYYDCSAFWNDINSSTLAFTSDKQDNHKNFDNCDVVYRGDFSKGNTNLFVPENFIHRYLNKHDKDDKHYEAHYYDRGYWLKYQDVNSGWKVEVYDVKSGDAAETKDAELISKTPGNYTYQATINLTKGETHEYSMKLHNIYNGLYMSHSGTITSANCTNRIGWYETVGENCVLAANGNGDYLFTVTLSNGEVSVSVDYPPALGDLRVIATTKDDDKTYETGYTYKQEANKKDTASFFVTDGMKIKLQYISSGQSSTPTWTTIQTIENPTEGIMSYQVVQGTTQGSGTLTEIGEYTGDFYIRTDGVDGGWDGFLNSDDNLMTDYGSLLSDGNGFQYDFYKTKWVESGKNVKFRIANKYNKYLSEDSETDSYISSEQNLQQSANVRFMWNSETNELKRAYLSGSTLSKDRFLVLLGNTYMVGQVANPYMFDKEGHEINAGGEAEDDPRKGLNAHELLMVDNNNWVYQVDIKAKPGCAVKLMADYNKRTQYFIGTTSTEAIGYQTIISGEDSKQYTMRAIYDFKTNRLTAGWIPDETAIDTEIKLGGDMLITRTHQGNAQQITFGVNQTTQKPGSISDIHHVYGVLTLQQDVMTNPNTMTDKYYENNLYWISFPFEVKISEIFGVDGYGTKWILQKYNGQRRADIGWFAETPTFWEYMSKSETMNAYEGYVLCLDPSYFNPDDADVWKNSAKEANFYFPSASGKIGIVKADSYTQSVPAHVCEIDRTFDAADHKGLNHMNTDSHWNVIGVPAFQDKSLILGNETKTDLKAIYEWNSANNTYTPHALEDEFTFKTMHAYMVQFYGGIEWSDVSMVQQKTPTHMAPRRLEETAHYMAEIEFHQGNKANDHTYINLADDAATDFLLNEDMMKIDNAGCPNIYSFAGNYNVAYNETSKASQTIDLGVSAPAAGNYKFHMPSDFTGTVTLIDNVEQTRTDLQVQDYELYLDKGTYNDRFQLEINLQSVVTNLDNVFGGQVDSDHAVKFIRDDKMFILRSGSIFDATGKRMK